MNEFIFLWKGLSVSWKLQNLNLREFTNLVWKVKAAERTDVLKDKLGEHMLKLWPEKKTNYFSFPQKGYKMGNFFSSFFEMIKLSFIANIL